MKSTERPELAVLLSAQADARHLTSVALLALALACSDRPSVAGRYTLVSVDGAPVPTGVDHGTGDTLWIYDGAIEFGAPDTALRTERIAGWRHVDSSRTSLWRYQRAGDSIVVFVDCAPYMRCPGPEYGLVRGDSLVLRGSRFGDVRLMYRRARARTER
jgi:hypothetical protein